MDIRVATQRKPPKFAALWLGNADNWKRFLDSEAGALYSSDDRVRIMFDGRDEWVFPKYIFWVLPLRSDVDDVLTEEMKSEDMFETTLVRPIHMEEYSLGYLSSGQLQPKSLRSTDVSDDLYDIYNRR